MKKTTSKVLVTGVVRLSYAHLDEPYSHDSDRPAKYSTAILIDKKDTAIIENIKKACSELAKENADILGNTKNVRIPLRDGDAYFENMGEKYLPYKGNYFMNLSSKIKPALYDKLNNKIEFTQDEFYSGCFARVSMKLYTYNVSGNKGITAELRAVQKIKDADRLDGVNIDTSNDFSAPANEINTSDDTDMSIFD